MFQLLGTTLIVLILSLYLPLRDRSRLEKGRSAVFKQEGIKMGFPVTVVIIGAGDRGSIYAGYATDFPKEMMVVAVAEPRTVKRNRLAKEHALPVEKCFSSWTDLAKQPRLADAAIIATPDRLHKEPAIAFAKLGYHILLEKPMAVTEIDCLEILKCVEAAKIIFSVCHVLRYTPTNLALQRLLVEQQAIGEIIHIDHSECIGFAHFAHAYVRGQWSVEADSTFSLLAKGCHDIDLICQWTQFAKCSAVSSVGSLTHFSKSRKPVEAKNALRCLDCPCERTCCYSAKKIYLESFWKGNTGWPVSIITEEPPTTATVLESLRDGPYGRCVYESNNDVVDHQVVSFEFETGVTATFTMIAFTEETSKRHTKIYGSKGMIEVNGKQIRLHDFLTHLSRLIQVEAETHPKTTLTGHDYADFFLMRAFVQAVGRNDHGLICTNEHDSFRSHRLVFAAEASRRARLVLYDW